ncbi:hypothetical protein DNTS_033203 [Danionella cerebrum]|uniref:Uncharacterized protein n=1 Tax=Danionella cerebrum TaxID=2873325 RepID=A0A553P173_9TELE|nr:hypothetical protein DNTS_033203 [Danionella translucida]
MFYCTIFIQDVSFIGLLWFYRRSEFTLAHGVGKKYLLVLVPPLLQYTLAVRTLISVIRSFKKLKRAVIGP